VTRAAGIGLQFGRRHPLLAGLLTIAATTAGGVLALVRALQLGTIVGVIEPLAGALFGLVVVGVWIRASRRDFSLSRAEWVVTLAGQGASVLAVLSVLKSVGPIAFQAASAAYLSAFLLGLVPDMILGLRRTLRDPKSAMVRTARAADALAGRRRRS
jgi:hypothetical protein